MTFDNGQNDFIKDNIKNKEKDNNGFVVSACGRNNKTMTYQKVSKQWLEDNNIAYRLVVGNLGEVIATGARIEVIT